MERCLLSVDWDYFVSTRDPWNSCTENSRCLVDSWYKRYLQARARGEDFQQAFALSAHRDTFWNAVRSSCRFERGLKAVVSDSHALSYQIAKACGCRSVILFDAHADLGYGGLLSLSFEVNCSNWLGRLLKDGLIDEAHIFYSPYSAEKPEHFRQMNSAYRIAYHDFCELGGLGFSVSAVHICRSGAWTPPWLDQEFLRFVDRLGIPCEVENCEERAWDPEHISLSDQIFYLLA